MKTGKNKKITRRDFIKKAGIAGAALGTAAVVPSFAGKAFAAKRDFILIGHPSPLTGPLAGFGETAKWVTNRAAQEINKKGGFYIKELGKKLPIKIKQLDSQSDPTKAGQLASRLILQDKIDLMIAYGTPATVNPVTAICERYKMPCIASENPIDMWLTAGSYKWSFLNFGLASDFFPAYYGMWEQIETNKVIGMLAANDTDGIAVAKASQEVLIPKGYKIVDLGRVPYGLKDYSSFIAAWKKEKVEILFGNMITPDWIAAWRQCHRMGFKPKIATMGRALLFPSGVEALGGNIPMGLSLEYWWGPTHPYRSSLTGYSCKKLCDDWTADTGKQWIQLLGFEYSIFEIMADVLNRVKTLDKEKIRDAIAATDLDTIVGHVKYTKQNYSTIPIVGAQWVKGDKFPWELRVVYNGSHKHIPVQGRLVPIP